MSDSAPTNKRHESWNMTTKPVLRSPRVLRSPTEEQSKTKNSEKTDMSNNTYDVDVFSRSPRVSRSPIQLKTKQNSERTDMSKTTYVDNDMGDHVGDTLTKTFKSSGATPKNLNMQQVEKTFSPSIAGGKNKSQNADKLVKTPSREIPVVDDATNSKVAEARTIQTGMDRYILVKRKSSPLKGNTNKISRAEGISNPVDPLSKNRFASLYKDDDSRDSSLPTATSAKPPPIYLRERSSNDLVTNITKIIGTNTFHIVPLRKGKIHETKVQTSNEKSFREITEYFNNVKKNYYTYQLKSSKGLAVVVKGIESDVKSEEVKTALEEKGFSVRSVINIFNRDKIPQPMFKVELEPDARKLKRNEVHPIYAMKYLLHRRISVEEPHKRSGPIQCQNCQEYGHTKKYCVLQTVCVVCGDLHKSSICSIKTQENKKCNNCGGNHTANYRGCPIYKNLKKKLDEKLRTVRGHEYKAPELEIKSVYIPQQNSEIRTTPSDSFTYANVIKQTPHVSAVQPASGIEVMIRQLTQSMNMFMSTMQSMMQDFMRSQNQLIQALISKK